MKATDFYHIHIDSCDSYFHIPSLNIISVKRGTQIDDFFRQFVLNEHVMNHEDFSFLKREIQKELPFLVDKVFPDNLINMEKHKSMQSIILPIAGHCNLRCSYCFAQNKGNFGFNDMTEYQVGKILDYVFSHNEKKEVCKINFFGGEPLLNIKAIKWAVEYVRNNYPDRPVIYGITTNGTILNADILQFIKENNIRILLSYDGPVKLSSHRVDMHGHNWNELIEKNINTLKEEGVKFQLRATISSDCKSLKDIYDYFESLNIPFSAVLAYKSRNIDKACVYEGKVDFFKREYKQLLDYYICRLKNRLPINCYSIVNNLNCQIKNREKNYYACSGGINLFAITDSGDIYSCEHFAFDKKYRIGTIDKGLYTHTHKNMFPQNVDKLIGCKNCWVKYLCGGGCFSEKELTKDLYMQLDEECELKRIYWDFILKLYIASQSYRLNFE